MSEETEKTITKIVEYVPYGTDQKIKLSIAMIQNLIAVKTKSGKTCSEADAMKFIAMCQARLLNPFEGDAFLIGYDGKDGPTFSLITAHQAFLKRAELHQEYDGMDSGVIVKIGDKIEYHIGDFTVAGEVLLGGWATVYFKTRKHPMQKRIRLERFKKPFGVWLDDAAGMIVKCAEADALRSSFPTMLGGLYLREEVVEEKPQVATPIIDAVPTHIKDIIAETTPVSMTVAPMPDNTLTREGLDDEKLSENLAKTEPPKPRGRPKKKLEPKRSSPSERPRLGELRAFLKVGNFTEEDFLKMLRRNEWDGWQAQNLEELSEEQIAGFLTDENKDTVMSELEQSPA